jgi:LCP family protein required for cell wall assembly
LDNQNTNEFVFSFDNEKKNTTPKDIPINKAKRLQQSMQEKKEVASNSVENKVAKSNAHKYEYIDISSSSENEVEEKPKKGNKKRKNKKKKTLIVLASLVLVLAIIAGTLFGYYNSLLNSMSKNELNVDNLGLSGDYFHESVKNIAVFGLDSRDNNFDGRSDAIIIITIDDVHDKIKMTTVARDSYVEIEGNGKDKITHAHWFGGPELAVKTLNQNFNMEITDYVTVNFFGMVEIIDEIGGVELDVDTQEMNTMNREYVPELNSIGLDCERITTTGLQKLSGAQALAYSRNRYSSGGDIDRGNRQKEVLAAIYHSLTSINANQLHTLVKIVLDNCQTSLSNTEITKLASWAALNMPSIESLSLPDADCNPQYGDAGYVNGIWYFKYDLDVATQKFHNFVNEDGVYYTPPTEE